MSLYIALIVYFLASVFMWFPIIYLAALVNMKAALTLAIILFIRHVSRVYLQSSLGELPK